MKKFVKKSVVGACALGKAVGQCIALPLLRGLWRSVSGTFVFGAVGCSALGFALARTAERPGEDICLAVGSSALLILSVLLMHGIGSGRKEDH